MDYGLTEQQEILRKSAKDFLTAECPKSLVRQMFEDEKGFPPDLWKKIAELGWPFLVFPEEYGGGGGSFIDLCVLIEETGRFLLPGPFLSTVIGGLAILEAGNEEQKKRLLPQIASGETIATLAFTEPSAVYTWDGITTKAAEKDNHYILNGTKLFIPDAHIADHIICVTRTGKTESITMFLVDAKSNGLTLTPLRTMARNKEFEVKLENVEVSRENMLGKPGDGWTAIEKVLHKATIAKSAEMLGEAQQVLDLATDYVKERKQFGVPVGSFQAVQHHMANMLIDLEGARFLIYQAAWKLSEGLPCDKEVAMAKAWASDGLNRVAALGHQCIGGVSLIEDHDLPLYMRRIKQDETTFGDAVFHREKLAHQLTGR
jgi:alkylation response protein AidB-like acyl-CoA dehydrogenase